MKRLLLCMVILFAYVSLYSAKKVKLNSPDKKTRVEIDCGGQISYSVFYRDRKVLDDSKIGLVCEGDVTLGSQPDIISKKKKLEDEHIVSPFYRFAAFDVSYSELELRLKDGLSVKFRAYNNGGVAYRFVLDKNKDVILNREIAEFNFDKDYIVYAAHTTGKKDPYAMAFQNTYEVNKLSSLDSSLIFLPITADVENGWKVTITESDLESYPGMFLKTGDKGNGLKGVFAHYPSKVDYYPWRSQEYVTQRESFIARLNGKQELPWRIISVSEKDADMPVNNLVYALASPNRIGDYSWVKPGKSAWEWWNDWGVYDVDFETGINMDTYKYYIDFAANYGLEYVILDEGWYDGKKGDMLNVIPELDMEELVDYAKSKNVGVILWTVFNVLDQQLEEACSYYAKMGIKGFKVDFLDRDDQEAVKMVYRIAEATAKHKLVLDLHGFYKPTGLNRTYPNILNFEGVFGMEEMKWSSPEVDMPAYDVTFPFIRLMAGSVDYTPGAMRNATKKDFQPIYSNPLSQGTRCHQLATYIVYDSPFTMLCDAPVLYEKEPEYTKFLSSLPVVFDDTKIIDGELGSYIVTARRKGNSWYIGGLNNWDKRELKIDMAFLEKDKQYKAVVYKDGVNAHKQAADYKVDHLEVNSESVLPMDCASGGGFVIKIVER